MTSCKVSKQCGGCKYIGRPYEYQLGMKQKYIDELFKGVCEVKCIIPCENPYYYRNKVHAAFKRGRGRKIFYGTYEAGSHRIVEHDKCYIENKKAQQIITTIAKLASKHKMSIYNEDIGKGLLRRVLVRVSETTGQIMVVLVIGSKYFTGKRNFIDELLSIHPEITTILSNYNDRHDSMILSGSSRVDYGKGYIEEVILGRTFRVSAESFLQINTPQAEALYSLVFETANVMPNDHILDCYCGTGTISVFLSTYCKEVIGVELNSKAVEDAYKNKKKNKTENVKFICRDATEYIEEQAFAGKHYETVVIDPPRAGTTVRFIEACGKIAPDRIVYVSCNPDTLQRDIKLFARQGFKAKAVTPVDMFPWTDNVECVCLLERL